LILMVCLCRGSTMPGRFLFHLMMRCRTLSRLVSTYGICGCKFFRVALGCQ
jgi:hypothetical protein